MQNLQTNSRSVSTQYDSNAVQRILARATAVEREHQELLSATQIEALGRELGLSDRAVRRAICEYGSGSTAMLRHRTGALPLLIRRDILNLIPLSVVLGAVTGAILVFAAMHTASGHDLRLTISPNAFMSLWTNLINFAAATATAIYAWRKADHRLGGMSGLLNGIGIAIALSAATWAIPDSFLGHWSIAGITVDYGVILTIQVIAAGVTGLLFGIGGQWWNELRRNEER